MLDKGGRPCEGKTLQQATNLGTIEADWRGVRAVILSEAKDLCARRARPFAEFTLSEAHGLRVTSIISKYLGQRMVASAFSFV